MANREQLKELVQKYISENYSKVSEEEASIEEMSTTAGAPAPATKYAFKRKK